MNEDNPTKNPIISDNFTLILEIDEHCNKLTKNVKHKFSNVTYENDYERKEKSSPLFETFLELLLIPKRKIECYKRTHKSSFFFLD